MERNCLQCNKVFKIRRFRIKDKKRGKFCCFNCYANSKKGKPTWNKGKKVSISTLKKMSEYMKKKWSNPEYKKQMSEAHKGRTKEKSSNWQGGKTKELKRLRNSTDFSVWRLEVFTRDLFTCQCCKKSGGYLEAHHILNFAQYPEKRFDSKNGVTLCKVCHRRFHKIYGKCDNSKKQLVEFFDATNGALTIT
jgi:NADH:ubiquinone oxidoreductase subunit